MRIGNVSRFYFRRKLAAEQLADIGIGRVVGDMADLFAPASIP